MLQVFVEMYNYTPEWFALSAAERQAFVGTVVSALTDAQREGVDVLACAMNDPGTDRRAPFDFFCVYRMPDLRTRQAFEAGVAAAGWYRFFEQVNLGGAALTPAGALSATARLQRPRSQDRVIEASWSLEKQAATVDGRTMTYVEAGQGKPVVFVHGDVMSSFLWHNVIPHISDRHRAIAVDLIGAGDSDKLPSSGEGTYCFDAHAHYLHGLLEALDLGDDVVVVGHDWGANLAFDWAMTHEDRVSGIAFAEPLLPPFEWSDWPPMARGPFEHIRTDIGGREVLEDNFFVEWARGQMKRVLPPEEWAEILRPYAGRGESRRPTLEWPRAVPFGDDDTPVRRRLEAQAAWLTETLIPKLHLAGMPGAIAMVGGRRRETIGSFPEVTTAEVEGLHWTPLDDPHQMGASLAAWLEVIRNRPGR
jgi:haloalkane dehalogenase